LGEHTAEILREELQFTEKYIAELRTRRVI